MSRKRLSSHIYIGNGSSNHFSKTQTAGTVENWEPKMRCVHQQWKPDMGEISESQHTEKIQSDERETDEQTQNGPMSIIPPQAAPEIDPVRRRSEEIAATRELENESSLRINPEQVRARRREMQVEQE
jgi:hypothetical protein